MKNLKNLIALLAIAVLTLASCSKSDEPSSVNREVIREQLAKLSVPSAQEIQGKLSASLRSASGESVSQRVLPLDKDYYEVEQYSAVKRLQYYEIASNGTIKRLVQVTQTFQIKDGVLDTTRWSASFDLDGIGIKRCSLWFSDYITSMTVFFHGANGLQLAYTANLYDGVLYLPALADGTWQVQVETFNKGVYQTFVTRPAQIRKLDPDELFLVYDEAMLWGDPSDNTVAIATVSAENLRGKSFLLCEDEQGNLFSQPIPATITSETISFSIPFKPKYIYCWGENGWLTDIDPEIRKGSDGLYHYNL